MSMPKHVREVAEVWDSLAAGYDESFREPQDLIEDEVVGGLIGECRQHHPGRVLDVGCGTGLALRLAEIPPEEYLGFDPSLGMLAVAKRKHPEYEFRCRE